MTVTIELSPEQAVRLKTAARAKGVAPSGLAKKLVAEHLPNDTPAIDPTVALLQSWLERDATTDEEVIKKAIEEEKEFERAINAERERAGARKVFP